MDGLRRVPKRSPLSLAAASVSVLSILASCVASPSHPADLGGCTGDGKVPCLPVGLGGGGTGPLPSDDGSDAATGFTETGDGGSCGSADQHLTTDNPACVPCIVQFCCPADTACSADPNCVNLVLCAQGCEANNANGNASGCVETSCTQSMSSTQNYEDFAACVQMNCTSCPLLPIPMVDF
jgi:hypothetical protein